MITVFHKMHDGKFKCVATVETDSLDRAYELTNHIDGPWVMNDEAYAIGLDSRDMIRSTSVGDRMVDHSGTMYEVTSFGFSMVGCPVLSNEQYRARRS